MRCDVLPGTIENLITIELQNLVTCVIHNTGIICHYTFNTPRPIKLLQARYHTDYVSRLVDVYSFRSMLLMHLGLDSECKKSCT